VLFFTESFQSLGTAIKARKALQRLVDAGELEQVAIGIYVGSIIDTVIGKVSTSIKAIAKPIARRDRASIAPTRVYALNRLGLSTEVPLKVVFLTNGTPRKIKVGNTSITFKKTPAKNVAAVGEISRLTIQALRTIGKEQVTPNEIKKYNTCY